MATIDDIETMLDTLSPEERKAVLGQLARRFTEERDVYGEESDYAAELRDTEDPSMIDAGRFKVASTPAAFLGATASRGLGEYAGARARDRMRRSVEDEAAINQRVQEAILSGGRGGLTRQIAAANALRAMERGR